MSTYAEPNACSACARSKRRCGRQLPSCARCVDRGRSCVYPSSRSRAASSSRPLLSGSLIGLVPLVEGELLAADASITTYPTANLIPADDFILDPAYPLMDSEFTPPLSLNQTPNAPVNKADWFLAPETWTIARGAGVIGQAAVVSGISTLKKYVAVLQSWFERWATTGSNPIIHSRLYSKDFPASVQISYATLASYIHRTPANTDTLLRIVEDRARDLLLENGAVLDWVNEKQWTAEGEQEVDLFAQLTRLQALLVYQIIGLFDGDIRSRHFAEGRIAVQNNWANKLFHSAGKALSNTHDVASNLPTPSSDMQQQWYLWILSESIRRTWLVAVSLSSVYAALQQGWSVCPGGVMYTNRSGLWDASSAAEWEKLCFGQDVLFLQRKDGARLPLETAPADIDDFGTAMLGLTVGGDVLEQWRDRYNNF